MRVRNPLAFDAAEDPLDNVPAGWARADTLAPGDTVRALAGLARVETVAPEARRQRVHNLSIADARTFLVGDGGAWVHNCPTGVRVTPDQQALLSLAEEAERRTRQRKFLLWEEAEQLLKWADEVGIHAHYDPKPRYGKVWKDVPHINIHGGTNYHIGVLPRGTRR